MKAPVSARRWLIVTVAIAVITSAWGISAVRVNQDTAKVRKMMQKMKTVCVGRFLIDLPEKAKVRFSTPRVAGVMINTELGYSEEQVALEIQQRENKLAAEKNEYGSPSLEKKLIIDGVNFRSTLLYSGRTKPLELIEYGKPVKDSEDGITVESFGIKDGVFYRFFGEDLASPRNENNVLELVKKFEARDAGSIPKIPGFCIENGLVHDPLTPEQNETIAMFASLEEHPDIVIRLDMSINVKDMEESLFEREAKNDIKLNYTSHFKSLRHGKRALNGIEGEEVGDKIKELNGTSAHSFMWVGLGKMRDVLAPSVMLELHTGRGRPGEPRNSSLSDDAVLQLWDRISSSLRIRPTSSDPNAGAAAGVPNTPLGALLPTGGACSQAGYWECKETGEVAGDRRKFFKIGERLPHVTLHGRPTLWQRLSGERPVHRITTVWKLVAYEYETLLAESGEARDRQTAENRNSSVRSSEHDKPDEQLNSGPRIADSDQGQA